MHYSKAFITTVKETPKEATMPSHILLLRGSYIRQIGAGIYDFMPLGWRVLKKVESIIRDEMDAAGAQQLLMPTMLPAEYFEASGRWETMGPILVKLEDRRGARYNLAPTHEEIITDLVRREVKSYKQLPINLYQIQTKFRDEPRPRAGLLRCREFIMKDAYSFDVDEAGALASYENMRDAYHRIFRRLGLEYRIVQADSGAMGGSTSAEFQVLATTGEDAIVACTECDYAANVEVAVAAPIEAEAGDPQALETIDTPHAHSIEEVVTFLDDGTEARRLLKSLVYLDADDKPVLAVVRGDHDVNEVKLARALGVAEVHLASDAAVIKATGAKVGFAGPVGFSGRILADPAALDVVNGVTGANQTDKHHRNVNHGRDFEAERADLRSVGEGDLCVKCGSALKPYRGIEGGHIFILGTHYSDKMGATYLDAAGKSHSIVMGCYGIGVSRLVAAIIEQHHDDDGICWPMAVAPYQVLITPLGKADRDPEVIETARRIHDELEAADVEVLLDDRDERPGVKFKDADLIGIPLRITVGARGLKDGVVEVKARAAKEPERVPAAECVATVSSMVRAALSS